MKQKLSLIFKTNVGFTLVELLVAIVIIVILSTLGIASFNSANTRNELQNQGKELQSAMRKLRTDSVAASKPVTGVGAAVDPLDPSCKSPTAGTSDDGTYYGSYITLTSGGSSFTTGVTCFDDSGNDIAAASVSTTNFTQGITSSAIPSGRTIFFSFDGNVYLLPTTAPTNKANADTLIVPGNQVSTPVSITLSRGGDYYIYVNGSGLICSQNEPPPGTCAN